MTQTHDIGEIFWHTTKVERLSAWRARGKTQEVDPPYREADPWVFHVPGFKFAIVIGKWRGTNLTEDEALLKAMRVGLDRDAPKLAVGQASKKDPAMTTIIWPHEKDINQLEKEAAIRYIDSRIIDKAEKNLVKDILGLKEYVQSIS